MVECVRYSTLLLAYRNGFSVGQGQGSTQFYSISYRPSDIFSAIKCTVFIVVYLKKYIIYLYLVAAK